MKPQNVALRDQLVAAIRESKVPISTPNLAKVSGLPFLEVEWWMPCSRACEGQQVDPWGYQVLTCYGEGVQSGETGPEINVRGSPWGDVRHTVLMPPDSSRIYPHLRALERRGLIARVKLPDHRQVFWAYVHKESDEAMNQVLDRLFAD
jgi:hypothetical protein